MARSRGFFVVAILAIMLAACVDEPGGGGVNIEPVPNPGVSTDHATTTSASPTTTSATTTTIPSFRINGRVSDDDGDPVARAVVTMGEQRVTTGPDGWFAFETTSPSTTMSVDKPGWTSLELDYDEATVSYEASISPLTIRGLRVSAETAADDAAFGRILQLARDTAINALVFDTKQEGGTVLYDTAVRDAHVIGAADALYDPSARIDQAHAEGLYTITRIVTFEDDFRASAFADEKLAGPWLDPRSDSARRYVLSLAEEACDLGFDEIQFDYVRWPSGSTATVTGQLDLTQAERLSAITDFLREARALLNPMGCAVAADVFGIVVSVPNDQGIGQRPEELSVQLDVLSPMVYPSHYSNGWIGYDDPNDHPYDVTSDAIADGLDRIADDARLRPWLQAFWWTNAQIRRSIQAAEDHGVGWILWNVVSNYDAAAIPTDAEVNP